MTDSTIARGKGVCSSQSEEAGNSLQMSGSYHIKEDSGHQITSDMSQSVSSNSSNRSDCSKDVHDERNNQLHGSNSISERKQNEQLKPKKGRVVQSRYKTAATSRNNSQGSNKSDNSSGSSSVSNKWANATLNVGPPSSGKRQAQKTKSQRPEEMKTTKSAAIPGSSISSRIKTKIAPSLPDLGHLGPQRPRAGNGLGSKSAKLGIDQTPSYAGLTKKANLNSTALNATIADITAIKSSNNVLSSTMVSGFTPGNWNPKTAGVALLELPDISAIKLEGNNSGNRTILSSVSDENSPHDCDRKKLPEVTSEDLEHEYMKYLQWAFVDVKSEATFLAQSKEIQNQISFLEQQVAEKQKEVCELKQKTDLFKHHQRVSETYNMQMNLLQVLRDKLPACEEAEKAMGRELEKKLHQIKMDNLFIPENHTKYRDELSEALDEQISILNELESLMEPRTHQGNATIKLLGELLSTTEHIQQCETEVQQAAGLAVEEASLQLGNHQMNAATTADCTSN